MPLPKSRTFAIGWEMPMGVVVAVETEGDLLEIVGRLRSSGGLGMHFLDGGNLAARRRSGRRSTRRRRPQWRQSCRPPCPRRAASSRNRTCRGCAGRSSASSLRSSSGALPFLPASAATFSGVVTPVGSARCRAWNRGRRDRVVAWGRLRHGRLVLARGTDDGLAGVFLGDLQFRMARWTGEGQHRKLLTYRAASPPHRHWESGRRPR